MLKRHVFKYPDLMKVTVLLHQGCSLAKLAFIYHLYLAVKAAGVTTHLGDATLAVLPSDALVPSADVHIAQKANNVLVFL